MLLSLSIKNFALIDGLQVSFNNGLTIITGETGAGKSILLDGLSLVLGKRADLNSLNDKNKKCVIEAVFDIANYNLKSIFNNEDLDYELQTIIRREILPSGKSRAFINDSPVKLNVLQLVGEKLIDIHSQHHTLQLVKDDFQFQVIDALANNKEELKLYKETLISYSNCKKDLENLLAFQVDAIKEFDYNTFLLNELNEIDFEVIDVKSLEKEQDILSNAEQIMESLSSSHHILSNEQVGLLNQLTELRNNFQLLNKYSSSFEDLYNRVESSLIELDDIFSEIEQQQSIVELNPNRLEEVNGQLQQLNSLMHKHAVNSISELLTIKESILSKVVTTENIETEISSKKEEINAITKTLDRTAKSIFNKRKKVIPDLVKRLELILKDLGMPNSQFQIDVNYTDNYFHNGKDELSFLFSANKGGELNVLKKTASGGELSRIMLAIKSILTQYIQLPTIMFDEIDTGVSGEISNKMAQIMLSMSTSMQVFAITHLPQIAAKGQTHLKVYKEDINEVTRTDLKKLNQEERIVEIAQMLSGIKMSDTAITHAKQLLN